MRLPRALHRFWAELTGRFWIACPSCGTEFGGHEWRTNAEDHGGHITTIMGADGAAQAICPTCTRQGVGCVSHHAHGRSHAQCPFLMGRVRPPRPNLDDTEQS